MVFARSHVTCFLTSFHIKQLSTITGANGSTSSNSSVHPLTTDLSGDEFIWVHMSSSYYLDIDTLDGRVL